MKMHEHVAFGTYCIEWPTTAIKMGPFLQVGHHRSTRRRAVGIIDQSNHNGEQFYMQIIVEDKLPEEKELKGLVNNLIGPTRVR